MITLHEGIDIPAPFEKLVTWSENFEEEFVKWSPYHLECSLYDKSLAVGSKVRFYEIVAGLDYDVTGTIIESEADLDHFRYIFLSNSKGAVITFAGRRLPFQPYRRIRLPNTRDRPASEFSDLQSHRP